MVTLRKEEMQKGRLYRLEAGIEDGSPSFSAMGRYIGTKYVRGAKYRILENIVMLMFVEDEYITEVQELKPMM